MQMPLDTPFSLPSGVCVEGLLRHVLGLCLAFGGAGSSLPQCLERCESRQPHGVPPALLPRPRVVLTFLAAAVLTGER